MYYLAAVIVAYVIWKLARRKPKHEVMTIGSTTPTSVPFYEIMVGKKMSAGERRKNRVILGPL